MKHIKKAVAIVLMIAMLGSSALAYEELAKGSKGEVVVELQNRLNELGYSVGTADGDYGNKTVRAIAEFQINNDIFVTGTADSNTQEAIFSSEAKSPNKSNDKSVVKEELLLISPTEGKIFTKVGADPNYDSLEIWFHKKSNSWLAVISIASEMYVKPIMIDDDVDKTALYLCHLLYKYSDAFDYMIYLPDSHDESGIGYNTSCIWGSESFSKTELMDFLMFIIKDRGITNPGNNISIETAKTDYSQEECQEIAITYMKNHLKPNLKNPDSLQITSVSGSKTDGNTYLFVINYTAMNSFGGYTPETYYCQVDYTTGEVTMGGMM